MLRNTLQPALIQPTGHVQALCMLEFLVTVSAHFFKKEISDMVVERVGMRDLTYLKIAVSLCDT